MAYVANGGYQESKLDFKSYDPRMKLASGEQSNLEQARRGVLKLQRKSERADVEEQLEYLKISRNETRERTRTRPSSDLIRG